MIGRKKLSTIRAEIKAAFAKDGIDIDKWFRDEICQLQRKPTVDEGEIETLESLRNALANAVKPVKQKPRRKSTSR